MVGLELVVALYGYDAGEWQLLAASDALPTAPQLMEWTSSSPSEATRFLVGAARTLGFAVAPVGSNGRINAGAAVSTDALEVRVKYHLGN